MTPLTDETMAPIRRHYTKIGLDQGWDADRFHGLCRTLRYLPEELAELCCIEPYELRRWLKQRRFPRSASLLFVLLEDALIWRETGRPGRLIVPVEDRRVPPAEHEKA